MRGNTKTKATHELERLWCGRGRWVGGWAVVVVVVVCVGDEGDEGRRTRGGERGAFFLLPFSA